jgi:bacteriocin biosynthesis cyclodehydratase domain-containing protein
VKVEAAAEALGGFDSSCRIVTVERMLAGVGDVAALVENADLVVNSADWPPHDIERWVNGACFAAEVPSITMSHSPPVGRVGPLYVPGETGCFECQEASYRERFPLYDELVEQRRGRPSPAATLGPVCAFVGGQVALEVVHHLTGLFPPATLGRAHIYDLRTMSVTHEDVPRVSGCRVCGG